MSYQAIDMGTSRPNDGEKLFDYFTKADAMFAELYASTGTVSHAITDVASASTCDIGAAATDRIRITGSVTITSFGTSANKLRFVHFDAALALTYNATTLILPDGVNKSVEAGDAAIFSSDASGNWRCLNYYSADDDVDSSDVTFTQSGTGAVERTALSKMRERVTVADFGAVADFTYASQTGSNNATAFQNAINATPAGGVVKIPAGLYRIASNLTVADKNITFEGEGSTGTHLIFDDCNGITLVIDDASNKGARFKGISFVSTANGTRTGIDYTGAQSSGAQLYEAVFEDCAWFGADRILALAWGANPNNGTCTWLKAVKLAEADRVTFINCIGIGGERSFTDNWPVASVGIDLNDGTSVAFYRCEFYRFETAIKTVGTSENIVMQGCAVAANRYGLITANSDPGNEHVLQGNHFSSYEVDVDFDSGGSYVSGFHTITGNFFLRRTDATSSGFYHLKAKCTLSEISGNQFAQIGLTPVASGDIAIRIYAGGSNNIIRNNIFRVQNICVQIDATANQNVIDGNHTIDDGTTILATAYVDNGTDTEIGFNGGDRFTGGTKRFANTGLKIYDTNASHLLTIAPGSNITANRTLTLTTGDADRTLTISGNATVSQDYSSTGSPTFANPAVTTIELGHASDTTLARSGAGDMTIEGNAVYRAGGTDVPVADGGTGASTSRAACANLVTWYVIGMSAVAASVSASTSEETLATVAIPAGAMGANGALRVRLQWTVTNSANNKTFKVRLGGIGGTAFRDIVATTVVGVTDEIVIQNRNSASSQVGRAAAAATYGFGTTGAGATTGTINTSNAQDLVITGQKASSGETLTLESYIVELCALA